MKRKPSSKPIHMQGWTKHWSGRGTAILDQIEGYKSVRPPRRKAIHISQKITALLRKFPSNSFYNDIYQKQIKGIRLSVRQLQTIDDHYFSNFLNVS